MNTKNKLVLAAIITPITVVLLVAVFTSECSIDWWTSFEQVEYQIRIVDHRDKPLRGVLMQVFDENWHESEAFPVSDYFGKGSIVSDQEGVIVFHHLRVTREFTGRLGSRAFGLLPFKEGRVPDFYLLFSYQGKSSQRKFNDLNEEASGFISNNGGIDLSPRVKKHWKWNIDKALLLPPSYQPPFLDDSEVEFVPFKGRVQITLEH